MPSFRFYGSKDDGGDSDGGGLQLLDVQSSSQVVNHKHVIPTPGFSFNWTIFLMITHGARLMKDLKIYYTVH